LQTVQVDAPGIPTGTAAARAAFESKPRDFSCKPSYPEVLDRCMKRQTGSPRLYPASSVTEQTLVTNSEARLHSILATLEECRAALIDSSDRETAQLVSVAILELRMKLNRIADSDLKALCDAMLPDEAPADRSEQAKPQHTQRRRPLLKLVK
jgi:hypothetical protein